MEHATHIVALVLAVGALALGPLLYSLGNRAAWLLQALQGFVLVAISALILVVLLPELIAVAGAGVLIALLAGLAFPMVLERFGKSARFKPVVMFFALSFLMVHALIDGVALGVRSDEHVHLALGAALIFHRLPVSLAVWMLVSPQSKPRAWGMLGLVAAATCVGFALGEIQLSSLTEHGLFYFQAFVAGSLLHVIAHHRHLPDDPESDTPAPKLYWGALGAVFGLVFVWLLPHSDVHEHERSSSELLMDNAPLIGIAFIVVALVVGLFRRSPSASVAGLGSEDSSSSSLPEP